VALRQPGDTMMLTLWREGDVSEVAVVFPIETPAEVPAESHADETSPPGKRIPPDRGIRLTSPRPAVWYAVSTVKATALPPFQFVFEQHPMRC